MQTSPVSAEITGNAQIHPELQPLAEQLQAQLWGLLPGFHRLVFEDGMVLLTLCIGDAKTMLREQSFEADSIYLDALGPDPDSDSWNVHTLKVIARCCRRGTRLTTSTNARSVQDALAQCGFVVERITGLAGEVDYLQGQYNPAWEPKKTRHALNRRTASSCVVIGAGVAGAAVAASLARRGWRVVVLDSENTPASGASGLPAGVLAPHISPDDSLLSRLSRSGVRATLQQAHALLQAGIDWDKTGVLERDIDRVRKLPAAWRQDFFPEARDWVQTATPEQLFRCGLPESEMALWHLQAGWIKPSSLVKAWLATPGIEWRGQAKAGQLLRQAGVWQVLDTAGQELAQAELVVLAAGFATRDLGNNARSANTPENGNTPHLALQAIRGQVTWALHEPGTAHKLPDVPVNGHGSFIPALPVGTSMAWATGATFERDNTSVKNQPQDDLINFSRFQTLLPAIANQLKDQFSSESINAWAGVRCVTPSRLPALGSLGLTDLWVCSGMGSRGLTFAALCAELLAAQLHAEPLPVEHRLAHALLPQLVASASLDNFL